MIEYSQALRLITTTLVVVSTIAYLGAFFAALFTLVIRRSESVDENRRTTAVIQTTGYCVAAVGPVVMGWVHERSGGWMAPFAMVTGVVVLMTVCAQIAARAGDSGRPEPAIPAGVLSGDDTAEHGMLSVEPRRRHNRNKKLTAVRARSGVRHRKSARLIVAQFGNDFVRENIAGPAAAGSLRIATLNHKILLIAVFFAYNAVEFQAVVKGLALCRIERSFGQTYKIRNG